MRKVAICVLSALLALTMTGCARSGVFLPTAQDITNVELMRTIAMDAGEKQRIRITVSGAAKSGADGGEPQPPVVLSQEGETVFGACLAMQTDGDYYVSYGAVDQCLIQEQAAQQNLTGLLDYLERDYEMRMDTKLFLAVEDSAEDYLKKMAQKTTSAADRLESVARDYPLESEGWPVKVREVLADLANEGCALVPVVRLKETEEQTTMIADGMACLSVDGVQKLFQKEQARALTMLNGKAEGGSATIDLSDGTRAGLRIIEVGCRWKGIWQEERLSQVRCQVRIKVDIAELQGGADPADPTILGEIERRCAAQLKKEIGSVLRAAQDEGTDLFHLERKLMMQCPGRCHSLEQNWEEWYAGAELQPEVSVEVERSYDVDKGMEGRG